MNADTVIFDGNPGSGKSTMSQRVYLDLLARGCAARWFYEHDREHPIFPPEERALIEKSVPADADLLLGRIVSRWQALAAGQRCPTIMDGALFQLPVGLWLLMNVPPDRILANVLRIEQELLPLAPALVYFYQADPAAAISAICDTRRDDDFARSLIEFIANSTYGRAREVDSPAHVAEFYRTVRSVTDAAFTQLRIPKLAIENSAGDWPVYERQIAEFLGLTDLSSPPAARECWENLTGRYRAEGTADELVVAVDQQGLCLDGHRPTPLIPKSQKTFYVAATCLELSFVEDEDGVVRRFCLAGNLEIPVRNWMKLGLHG